MVIVKVENGNVEEIRRGRQLMECVIQVRGSLREYRSIQDKVAVRRQVHLGSISRLSIVWQGITQDPNDLALMSQSGTFRTGRRRLSVIMINWCGDWIGVCHIGACHGLLRDIHCKFIARLEAEIFPVRPLTSYLAVRSRPKSKIGGCRIRQVRGD
jgi:hypothetical protein